MPAKRDELRTLLHEWRKLVHAQMPTPNPGYDPEWVEPPTPQERARDAAKEVLRRATEKADEDARKRNANRHSETPSPLPSSMKTRSSSSGGRV